MAMRNLAAEHVRNPGCNDATPIAHDSLPGAIVSSTFGPTHTRDFSGFQPKIPLASPHRRLLLRPFNQLETIMARICAVTGRRPVKGSIINRKGQSKKSGGIGTHV